MWISLQKKRNLPLSYFFDCLYYHRPAMSPQPVTDSTYSLSRLLAGLVVVNSINNIFHLKLQLNEKIKLRLLFSLLVDFVAISDSLCACAYTSCTGCKLDVGRPWHKLLDNLGVSEPWGIRYARLHPLLHSRHPAQEAYRRPVSGISICFIIFTTCQYV